MKVGFGTWHLAPLGFILASCLAFVAVFPTFAQSTVTINGTIKDQTGASVAGATVTATNVQTGIQVSAPSDESGRYTILGLTGGHYDIQAAQAGFATEIRRNVEFFVATTITIDFALAVSSITQTVEVKSEAALVDMTQSTVSNILQPTQLDDLPILDRNFAEMAALTPGVQVTPATTVAGSTATVMVDNGTTYETGWVVDDIPVTKPSDGGLYLNYAQDWIQEFSVLTQQFPVEYGGTATGIVNAITRSGTNEIHGRAYGFFQNAALNSAPAFLAVGAPKPPYNQERAGGMVGGPIKKDKLFFFLGYEYYRDLASVITTPIPVAFQGSPFSLPQDAIGGPSPTLQRTDIAMVKIDYQINSTNSISVIGNIQVNGTPLTATGGATTTEDSSRSRGGDYQESVNWKWITSATSLNELRFVNARTATNGFCNYAKAVGSYPGTTPLTQYGIYSSGNPTGFWASLSYPGAQGDSGLVFGCPQDWGGVHVIGLYAGIYETFTKTRGNHEFKIGGSATDPNDSSNAVRDLYDGQYSFASSQTGPFVPSTLTTYPNSYTVAWGPTTNNQAYYKVTGWSMGLFAQDTWKVTPNLTLSPGLRYDADFSNANFDKYTAKVGGNPINNDLTAIAPRMGFAWTPFKEKSTVFRGGFGIFYGLNYFTERATYGVTRVVTVLQDSFTANSSTANPYCIGNSLCTSGVPSNLQNALKEVLAFALVNDTLPNLSPAGGTVTVGGVTYTGIPTSSGTPPRGGIFNIDQNIRNPGTMQVTGGVQHSFGTGFFFSIDYGYVRGFDQIMDRNININQSALPAVSFINPNYTTEFSYGNGGWFTSNSLLAKVTYRDHRGDLFQGAYTLAYAYGNGATTNGFTIHSGGGKATDPFNYSLDDGPLATDQRNTLVTSGVIKTFVGIDVDPIMSFASALPYTATTTATAGQPFASPNCEPWYSSCYPTLNGVTYTKNSLRGDDTFALNARIQKSFRFGESRSFTAMFEGYNLTNKWNLGTNFVTNVSSTGAKGFMKPTGIAGPMRQLQIGGRFDF